MGLELAKMHVRIRGDSSALPEDFQEAKAVANKGMRDIADSMHGIFRKASGIGDFLQKGIGAAASYEQTVTEFETLIGSAEKTEKTLKDLTAFAVKTPFEMPQLLGVTRSLLTFGERGKQLMSTISMLGDASQGNAEKFSVMGRVYGQIQAQTKLTRERFQQLSERGILSLQDLSMELYGTKDRTKEADAAITKGTISFDTFRKALERTTQAGGRNHNAMEKQSKTLTGLKSTLSDAINITGRMLAQPLMPYLKAITIVQIKVAEGFASIVEAMGAASSGAAVGAAAVASLGLALTSASLAARFFGISIRSAIIGTGIGAILLVVGAALGAIVMWITDAVTKTDGWGEVLVAVGEAWDVVMEAVSIVGAALLEIWESVFGASLTDSVGAAAKYIADLIKKVADWVVEAKSYIISVAEGISFFFRNVSNLVQLSLVESLLYVMDIMPQIEGIYQEMAISFAAVWSGAGAFFKAWISNISGGITEFKNLVSAVWEAIKAGWKAAFDPDVSVMDAMSDAFIKTLAEQKDAAAALNPFDEWKKAAKETREEMEAGFAEEGGAKGALESRRQALLDAITQDEKARDERLAAKDEEPAGKDEEGKKPDAPKADPKVDAGRYGFEAFGDKFQDAILKAGAGDQQQKMVGLMEHGNATQDQLLAEAKKKKGGLGK